MLNRQIHFAFFTPKSAFILAALVSLALHWRIFSLDLMGQHVWRQTETQLNIRHFAKDDFNILNPTINYLDYPGGIHRMEFPLMQWIVGGLDRIFGYSIMISRIFLFLLGLLTVLGIMKLAKIIFTDPRAPAIAAWTFSFSPLFYYYTMNPLPDMMAVCGATWGITFGMQWIKDKKKSTIILSGICLAIGALTKLPFILYFAIFPCYWWMERKNGFFRSMLKSFYGWGFIIAPLTWYVLVIPGWTTNPVVQGLFKSETYSINDLLRHLWGNFSSTLPELLINYAAIPFFLAGIFFLTRKKFYSNPFFIYLAATGTCVFTYFIFELHLIATNHDYYLFPFLPLLFMIITFGAIRLLNINRRSGIIVALLICILPLTAFLRIDNRWDIHKPGFNPDLLLHASEIRNIIPENVNVITANDPSGQIWFYYLDRSGWNFYDERIDQAVLSERIKNGEYYFISDSRKLEKELNETGKLGEMKGSFGTINIYKLPR
ncbi:MAG: glycosyltransferase family 39 protein [Bacteroidota bacterium]|nr:glycosyltransferase family 39 protein [Bacteroidota bacterium]